MLLRKTFEERYEYLRLHGNVGVETFGFDRYLNQKFYKSKEWQNIRRDVILRDQGCDLGVPNYCISGRILIHHINPITPADIKEVSDNLLNPDNLVCVSYDTHNAIHFGDERLLRKDPVIRRPGDTKLW